jgi:hypothetical protein
MKLFKVFTVVAVIAFSFNITYASQKEDVFLIENTERQYVEDSDTLENYIVLGSMMKAKTQIRILIKAGYSYRISYASKAKEFIISWSERKKIEDRKEYKNHYKSEIKKMKEFFKIARGFF